MLEVLVFRVWQVSFSFSIGIGISTGIGIGIGISILESLDSADAQFQLGRQWNLEALIPSHEHLSEFSVNQERRVRVVELARCLRGEG